ncbi:MAG: exodeoxyribonuclease VII large subunit [Planctomycetota bacterium]|jgi:exodeoxyribonuclease VII large subunit
MQNKKVKIYTISQVTALIKEVLGNNLPGRLTVTGEITDWKAHQSGHCYFSLKDENALLPCVMWKSKFSKVKFKPENGLAVIAKGYIDIYEPQGKYQFYADSMQPAGIGALQLAFQQLVERLYKEGLFDESHKKPLPVYPERIGILTSETGAVVEDIRNSIYNRWPCVKLFLYPVPVQGEGAGEEIASALRDVNWRNDKLKLDVVIIGRGGGSMEDLWPFNEEVLARAIFDSKIPVISAVGHEIDTTVADLVADVRASTPTKAGVAAVPDMYEALEQLTQIKSRLGVNVGSKLKFARQSLETILASAVFRNPLLQVEKAGQHLDEFSTSLSDKITELVTNIRNALTTAYEQLGKLEPHRLLGKNTVALKELENRAIAAIITAIHKGKEQITAKENRLIGLNPKAVLSRGYSITTSKKTGRHIKDLKEIDIGDLLITELAKKNFVESKVINKQNKGK